MMSEPPVIERIPLKHPLPAELEKMKRDETVCQFCGVSYLIHREVKLLEEKVIKLEKELENYQGCEERERKVQRKLEIIQIENTKQQTEIQQQASRISTLLNNLKSTESKLSTEVDSRREFEEKYQAEVNNNIKLNYKGLKEMVPHIVSTLKEQKQSLSSVRLLVEEKQNVLKEIINRVQLGVMSVRDRESEEMSILKNRVKQMEEEKYQEMKTNSCLKERCDALEREGEKLADTQTKLTEIQQECEKINSQNIDLRAQNNSLLEKNRLASCEADQHKEMARNKTKEVEDINLHFKRRENNLENTISRLQHEIRQREAELEMSVRENQVLKRTNEQQSRLEEEVKRRVQVTAGESQQLKEVLVRVQQELEALKAEREEMIISHQNRIEQLRESFKQKLAAAEKWPSKLDDTVLKIKQQHAQELAEMEAKIRDSYNMDFEIEKQKHQELLDKYKSDYEEAQKKLKAELKGIGEKHNTEMRTLEKQLSAARNQTFSNEASLKQEVQSLKGLVSELENRLGKVGDGHDKLMDNLKAELRETEQDLSISREGLKDATKKLEEAKEEIVFLQETVRRECEERFELIEALSETKEQLLVARRSTGPLTPPPPRPGGPPLSQPPVATRGLAASQPLGTPSPPGHVLSNNINLDFSGAAKPPSNRHKEGSVDESRQRIAAAVGRKV